MRRKIYVCKSCGKTCTIRTHNPEMPSKCIYWMDYCNWVRIDKHQQTNMEEF